MFNIIFSFGMLPPIDLFMKKILRVPTRGSKFLKKIQFIITFYSVNIINFYIDILYVYILHYASILIINNLKEVNLDVRKHILTHITVNILFQELIFII